MATKKNATKAAPKSDDAEFSQAQLEQQDAEIAEVEVDLNDAEYRLLMLYHEHTESADTRAKQIQVNLVWEARGYKKGDRWRMRKILDLDDAVLQAACEDGMSMRMIFATYCETNPKSGKNRNQSSPKGGGKGKGKNKSSDDDESEDTDDSEAADLQAELKELKSENSKLKKENGQLRKENDQLKNLLKENAVQFEKAPKKVAANS